MQSSQAAESANRKKSKDSTFARDRMYFSTLCVSPGRRDESKEHAKMVAATRTQALGPRRLIRTSRWLEESADGCAMEAHTACDVRSITIGEHHSAQYKDMEDRSQAGSCRLRGSNVYLSARGCVGLEPRLRRSPPTSLFLFLPRHTLHHRNSLSLILTFGGLRKQALQFSAIASHRSSRISTK